MNTSKLRIIPLAIALACASGWAGAQAANGNAAPGMTAPKGNAEHKLSHGDRSFIEDAAKGGMFEVESGKLAASKASDPAVKEFADKLVHDHGKGNDELMKIAEAKDVKMPGKDKWSDRHELNKLGKLNGKDFDREFAQHAVKDHQKDIKDFEKATAKLQDPDVKAWAEKQLPVLREHLAMAQKLAGRTQTAAANKG